MSDSKWYSTPQEAMVADLNKQLEMIDNLRKQLEVANEAIDRAWEWLILYNAQHGHSTYITNALGDLSGAKQKSIALEANNK
jgi:hypothetical protein